ncbi:hypothetical protein SLA2020_238180 [Shorea laevis]
MKYQVLAVLDFLNHGNMAPEINLTYIVLISRRRGKEIRVRWAIKLDLSKAFDRVKWNFLEGVMTAMGLPERWTARVMQCDQWNTKFQLMAFLQ